jgi:hypothetical protein
VACLQDSTGVLEDTTDSIKIFYECLWQLPVHGLAEKQRYLRRKLLDAGLSQAGLARSLALRVRRSRTC